MLCGVGISGRNPSLLTVHVSVIVNRSGDQGLSVPVDANRLIINIVNFLDLVFTLRSLFARVLINLMSAYYSIESKIDC